MTDIQTTLGRHTESYTHTPPPTDVSLTSNLTREKRMTKVCQTARCQKKAESVEGVSHTLLADTPLPVIVSLIAPILVNRVKYSNRQCQLSR